MKTWKCIKMKSKEYFPEKKVSKYISKLQPDDRTLKNEQYAKNWYQTVFCKNI